MRYILRVVVAVCILGMAAAAWSAGSQPYQNLSSIELKAMMDRREADLVVIDSRSPAEYQEAHIREAVNVPLSVQEGSAKSIDYPKESKIVFYCNGFT